jgi:hypothetical protein
MAKTPKVTLRIRVKDENGVWKRRKTQFTANGRLKHVEGAHYVLRVKGKYGPAITDPDVALASLKREEATLLAEQREHQDWPVHPRQVGEAQGRGQRGVRQPHPKSHD